MITNKIAPLATKVGTKVTNTAKRFALVCNTNAPTILTVTGVCMIVAGGVLAVKKAGSDKAWSIRAEHADNIEDICNARVDFQIDNPGESYPDDIGPRAMTKEQFHYIWENVKLYAIPIGLAAGGIASIFVGHGILRKRHAAMIAAYDAVSASFAAYRGRVKEELGEDADTHFMYGTGKKVSMVVNDTDEEGNEVQKEVVGYTDGRASMYAKVFDITNENFSRDYAQTEATLRQIKNYCNLQLKAKGYLLLNDVYDALGLDRTTEGAVVGWLSEYNGGIDGYVEFITIPLAEDEEVADTGAFNMARGFIIDFNVDGPVFDKISDIEKRYNYRKYSEDPKERKYIL